MKYKAKCCCEACSVVITGEPVINAVCRCTNCKRRTGSAFGWNCYFKSREVMQSEGSSLLYELTSAGHQKRWFCAACGTTLFGTSDIFKNLIGIAGGCISEPALPSPDVTVSNINRCEWVTLPDNWRQSLNPPT